jgi:predicted KAP-like P-loop ATPase
MAGGFDAPREDVAEDHLGRAAFAREIAQLATNTPDEWSTRIAIYGPWGSGKTTVMNYARPLVE